MNDEIGKRLREAAEQHQPDRARMLARVHRGMAQADAHRTAADLRREVAGGPAGPAGGHGGPVGGRGEPAGGGGRRGLAGARRGGVRVRGLVGRGRGTTGVLRPTAGIGRSWPRVALAGLAAAGIVAVAGIAVAAVLPAPPPQPDTAITLSSPHPTPTSAPSPTQPARTTTTPTTPWTPDVPSPTDTDVTDGPLTATGTIDPHSHEFWTQDALTLTTTEPLTALTVELRVEQTGGVATTGQWQTGPADDFTVTVDESDGTVVYRWTLKPGHTAPATRHTFAAQYNHATGRTSTADTYTVRATTADGSYEVRGGFTAGK